MLRLKLEIDYGPIVCCYSLHLLGRAGGGGGGVAVKLGGGKRAERSFRYAKQWYGHPLGSVDALDVHIAELEKAHPSGSHSDKCDWV